MASLYMIPPRDQARGHVSGTWRHDDCIFTGSCVVETDDEDGYTCVIRFIQDDSKELFALCRVPFGALETVVEPACDSSRTFVIRVEDLETRRHAFLGLSFEERSVALDFRMALAAEEASKGRQKQALSLSDARSSVMRDGSDTHARHDDLRLKDGETLRIDARALATIRSHGGGGGGSGGGHGGGSGSGVGFVSQHQAETGGGMEGGGLSLPASGANDPGVVARDMSHWQTF